MKNSLKKLSMMVMLGLLINTISLSSDMNSSTTLSMPDGSIDINPSTAAPTSIKVKNLLDGQSIAAVVRSGNSIQTPVNGMYILDPNTFYQGIVRSNHKDSVIQNTGRWGNEFTGKTTWDIANNKIS